MVRFYLRAACRSIKICCLLLAVFVLTMTTASAQSIGGHGAGGSHPLLPRVSGSVDLPITLPAITGTLSFCVGAVSTLTCDTGGIWTSSNPAIAQVGDTTGVVAGLTAGIDTIYFTLDSSTAMAVITVNPLPNAGTILGVDSLCVGATFTFADSSVGGTWGSLTPTKMSVVGGVATGLTAGYGIVGYTVSNSCGGATATLVVTVLPLPNAGAVTGSANVCPGSSITLGDTISGGMWGITNGNAIDSAGIVTGIVAGADTVVYAYTNSCGTAIDSFPITIVPLPAAGVITGDSGMCRFAITTLYDTVSGGKWSVTNNLLTIDSLTGALVSGGGVGLDTAIYTYTNLCGAATAAKTVTVAVYPGAGTIYGPDSVCAGAMNVYVDSAGGGVWGSTGTGILYIDDSSISAVGAGTDTLYYAVSNACATVYARLPITVTGLPFAGIVFGADSVCQGSTTTLIASHPGGMWAMSNPTCTVDSLGDVTGVSFGGDTVIYSVTNICGTATTTYPLGVKAAPVVDPITSPGTVCVYGSASVSDAAPGGVWSLTNARALVVDTVLLGQVAGLDTVAYTVTNACGSVSATAVITVLPLPTAAVVSGKDSVCTGDSITLTASIAGGIWSSEYASFATVHGMGHVLGVATGADTIFYIVSNTCGSVATAHGVMVVETLSPMVYGLNYVCVGGATDSLFGVPSGGTWSVTNGDASIVGIADGAIATGHTAGYDTIVYKLTNYCGTGNYHFPLQVEKVNTPTITGSTLLCVGKQDTLYGIPPYGYWSVSDTDIATVQVFSTAGVLTADSVGVDTITYYMTNICGTGTYSMPVTVHTKAWCDSAEGVPSSPQVMEKVGLYPNPNTGSFTLVVPQQEPVTVTVFDLPGRLMAEFHLDEHHGEAVPLSVQGLATGTYLVRLVGTTVNETVKMVVNAE